MDREPPPDDHDQVDDWPDPDHGREGAKAEEDEAPVIRRDDIKIMRGEDTGLYGEDEDHPQDIVGAPNTHGGYDVYRHL